ncbi:mucin-2-like isoform X2 [Argopecten irradians]
MPLGILAAVLLASLLLIISVCTYMYIFSICLLKGATARQHTLIMNSHSPAQHVPTTPSLRLRYHEYEWWESPSAVVPETDAPSVDSETPVVPRTPQNPFPVSPWVTPLNESRGTTPTFRTPLSSTTPTLTPLPRTRTSPLRGTIFVHTPTHGMAPTRQRTPSGTSCYQNVQQKWLRGGEQMVPATPKFNEAATPKSQALMSTKKDTRPSNGSRTPRILLSPEVQSTNYRHLDLFSGDDYFD